jgi:hypothetical protein
MLRLIALGGAEAGVVGYVCKRLAETGEGRGACTCSSDKYDRADVNTVCVAGCDAADGIHVGCYEDSCCAAEVETCVRWQVATVKDSPGQSILLSCECWKNTVLHVDNIPRPVISPQCLYI